MADATTKSKRKIIRIDEEKCDGCGLCITSCAEGALQLVDGKARLVSENFCDGLGACIGECPQGALIIEEREAPEFNEEAVKHHFEEKRKAEAELPCGCPSTRVTQFKKHGKDSPVAADTHPSMLSHWPIQLRLVPPTAPFLKNSDLMLIADCVPFAYADFHRDFLRGHAVLVACPKLDDFDAHLKKLTEIIRQGQLNSLTVVHMEVPCCSGLVHMAKQAIAASCQDLPFREVTISITGQRL